MNLSRELEAPQGLPEASLSKKFTRVARPIGSAFQKALEAIQKEAYRSVRSGLEKAAMLPRTLVFREEGGIDEGTAIFLALVAVTALTVFTLYKQLERGNTTIPFLQ